jgi:acyl-CoA synthetase (NDP forming)
VVKNSLKTMFRPKSVAILGASTNEEKIGGRPVRYLKHYEFDGPIYPVNPNAAEVQGLKAYKSILNIEGEVDLALFVLPAALVIQGVRECAEKGVKSVVIFSAGFADTAHKAGHHRVRHQIDIAP